MKLPYPNQIEAIQKMKNGCVLCGGVGSGKSLTSLGYYYICNGGDYSFKKRMKNPKNLYIITTAQKRDKMEWEGELVNYHLSTDSECNSYNNEVHVDSWNNIGKYVAVKNAFFIFDEQRLIGNGAWVKSFYKIAAANDWILLSATPGDSWLDYIPVFVANGFYKNKTEFITRHVIYARFSKYPKVDKYFDTQRLVRLRNSILVDIDFDRKTEQIHIEVPVEYDKLYYKDLMTNRWNYEKNDAFQNAGELCFALRKACNSDPSRAFAVRDIVREKKKVIVFYNYDYELEILLNIDYGKDVEVAQWNGHAHQPMPEGDKWVYLVNYTAGCEGWNCITTDTIIFYSNNYSYRVMIQAAGRIDRLNTPFIELYYYHLNSKSPIDIAIKRALSCKKKFNESRFVPFTESRP